MSNAIMLAGVGEFMVYTFREEKTDFFFFFFFQRLFIFGTERDSMNRGGAEREGDTESETGSRL